MKKILFSLWVLFPFLLASGLAMESLTEKYTEAYQETFELKPAFNPPPMLSKSDYVPSDWDWSKTISAPVTITWSIDPLVQSEGDGIAEYLVTIIVQNTQNINYLDWSLKLVNDTTTFVSSYDPLLKAEASTTEDDFGGTPKGAPCLLLSKANPQAPFQGKLFTYTVSAYGTETLSYKVKIAGEGLPISPEQIVFSASYYPMPYNPANPRGRVAYALQRDHLDQAAVTQ